MKVLVIDVGGTAIKYAVMDEHCLISEKGKIPTPYENGVEGFTSSVCSLFKNFKEKVTGIAMCMPGIIDSDSGFCISGGSLEYNIGQPMKRLLEEQCHVPVYIENDGKCAVWAEYWKGALAGHRSGIVMALGTAVAGGILIDGKVWKGNHFSAGELSYLCSDVEHWDEKDRIAGNNCSAVVFVEAVSRRLGIENDGKEVFKKILEGNETAVSMFCSYLKHVAGQIYNLQIILDPDVIAIGGGISQQKILLTALQEEVDRFYRTGFWTKDNAFLPRPKLTLCKYGNDANLIGALYHFLQKTGNAGRN